jgi:hypothetical protein
MYQGNPKLPVVTQFAVAALSERRNSSNQKAAVRDRRYKNAKLRHHQAADLVDSGRHRAYASAFGKYWGVGENSYCRSWRRSWCGCSRFPGGRQRVSSRSVPLFLWRSPTTANTQYRTGEGKRRAGMPAGFRQVGESPTGYRYHVTRGRFPCAPARRGKAAN